jgi:hypothetical protein
MEIAIGIAFSRMTLRRVLIFVLKTGIMLRCVI